MKKLISLAIVLVGISSMSGLLFFKKRFFFTDAISPSPIVFSYNVKGRSNNKPHSFKIYYSEGGTKRITVDKRLYRSLGSAPHHYKIMPTRALKRLNFEKKENLFILKNFFCENDVRIKKIEVYKKKEMVSVYECPQ